MPIYEYRCPNGHVFDVFKSMTAPAPEKCPVCGEGPVEGVLYPVAVHFKGSGFYSTDYGRGNAAQERARSKDGERTRAVATSTGEKKDEPPSRRRPQRPRAQARERPD